VWKLKLIYFISPCRKGYFKPKTINHQSVKSVKKHVTNNYDNSYWSLFDIALFSAFEQTLSSHVILRVRIDSYSMFLNIHRSGVPTVLAWPVPL